MIKGSLLRTRSDFPSIDRLADDELGETVRAIANAYHIDIVDVVTEAVRDGLEGWLLKASHNRVREVASARAAARR